MRGSDLDQVAVRITAGRDRADGVVPLALNALALAPAACGGSFAFDPFEPHRPNGDVNYVINLTLFLVG